jgi:hypothetical protein
MAAPIKKHSHQQLKLWIAASDAEQMTGKLRIFNDE